MSQVVNFKSYGSAAALTAAFGARWVYIGRSSPHHHLPASPLANPHRRQTYGGQPGCTLPYYRRWLWQRIQARDEAVIAALSAIDDKTILVCWCKPGSCHGDVVLAASAWLKTA